VKCPKCSYLGFETGDRCKNCGYDFSLLSVAEFQPAEYEVHPASIDDVPIHVVDRGGDDAGDEVLTLPRASVDAMFEGARLSLAHEPASAGEAPLRFARDVRNDHAADARLSLVEEPRINQADEPQPLPVARETPPPSEPLSVGSTVMRFAPASGAGNDPALPLFAPANTDEDEPLVKLPAVPRPPLAVRRTPAIPRLRAVPRPPTRSAPGPVLEFPEEDRPPVLPVRAERASVAPGTSVSPGQRQEAPRARPSVQPTRVGARIGALLIDYVILFGIDAAVIYFTVRMAGLAPNEWRLLPVLPTVVFLGLLKVAYFYAFTAVGGQTIGKMAVGTSVVTEDGKPLDAARAMRRTSVGALSFLMLGLGFLPALFGDGRALHDRLSSTRVVRLRSV
jgi:uncharacterized RDD family membrane protein YckC